MSDPQKNNDFERASEGKQSGIVAEFLQFLGQNKKFWLIPLLLVLLLLGALIVLGFATAQRARTAAHAWRNRHGLDPV